MGTRKQVIRDNDDILFWEYVTTSFDITSFYLSLSTKSIFTLFLDMLEAQLISSGAFEISLNDIPIWSKLATGRIPSPQELFSIIESHLQFTDNFLEKNPEFVK